MTLAAITAAALQACTQISGQAALDTEVSIHLGVYPDLIPSVTDASVPTAEQNLTERTLSEFWNVSVSAQPHR
jgi:hypothetical protein